MSTIKDKPAGTPTDTKLIVLANPTTGAMEQITLLQLKNYIGASALSTPAGFTATPVSSTQINLSWSAVTNATSYTLDRSPDQTTWTNVYTGSGTSYSNTALTASTLYYYRIKATASGYTDSSYATANATTSATYDTDAQAFFTAAGITDATQKTAVNNLVLSLKSNSLWTPAIALYPFVGGTSATHAVNLKAPGTNNITWNGTNTHNANGVSCGGTNADYGNTGLIPSAIFSGNSGMIGVYLRTAGTGVVSYMGVIGASSSVAMSNANPNMYGTIGESVSGAQPMTANPAAYTRFLAISRTGALSSDCQGYRDGTNFGAGGNAFSSMPGTYSITIGARNNAGTIDTPTTANIAFACVFSGLNSTQIGNLTTAINAYQLALSRNV